MLQLTRYEDFVDRVDELGFMSLSVILPGLPSLSAETREERWHTGDAISDPWSWKDRAAEEKRLAFGCILGKHRGFISGKMYPLFYKAFHPQEHMEELRTAGQISEIVWKLWQLFEGKTLLSTSDIRNEMGVTLKKGGSKVDRALIELQQYFYITVAGNRRKTNKTGQPYGWPAIVYDKVENWAPAEWIQDSGLSVEEARAKILDHGMTIGKDLNPKLLAKTLNISI